MFRGHQRFDRTGPCEQTRSDLAGEVGQIQNGENTIKQGTRPTLSNLANFLCDASVGLKDFTAPDPASKPEVIYLVSEVGQIQNGENAIK